MSNTGTRWRTGRAFTAVGLFLLAGFPAELYGAGSGAILLQNGVPMANLAGTSSSETTFRISIPAGAHNLQIQTSRGEGDCDLYLRFEETPTLQDYDQRSVQDGTAESLTVPTPMEGDYYATLYAFAGYRRVKLVATYEIGDHRVAAPVLSPGPGIYRGPATVRLTCATPGAHVHYTTNGSPPLASSPLVPGPLTFTANTILKSRAFKSGLAESGEIAGEYSIRPAGGVVPLKDGVPLINLAGMAGSDALYKINVPPGQHRLVVRTSGGRGNVDLALDREKAGAPAKGSARRGNHESIIVSNPSPGTWFIRLHARGSYSGVALTAGLQNRLPDLIAWPGALSPYLSTERFDAGDCDVVEGHVQEGTRRLLRFNTESRNIGDRDLVMGRPENHPGLFEYHECHGHYHFNGFARYRLLDDHGQEVALGRKVSFCLEDIQRWDPQARRRSRFTCDNQGIQAGWADIYDAGLSGQWIDVTGVSPGDYTLEIEMNPDHSLPEASYENNISRARIQIEPPPTPVDLTSGTPVGPLSGAQGNEKLYRIQVPAGGTELEITLHGGTGDADLFVKFGAAPERNNSDYSSEAPGTEESINIPSPAAGDWYILLVGFTDYAGTTLEATAP